MESSRAIGGRSLQNPVNVAKNTSEEQGDGELKNMKEIYSLLVLRIG